MVERWVLRHDTDTGGAEGGAEEGADTAVHRSPNKPRRTKAETTAVAYKRTVVMVRTLHALCRSLPANRFHRAARQSQNRGLRFAVEHEVREGRQKEDEGEGGLSDDLTKKPTGNRGTFREHSFTPVRTPAGGDAPRHRVLPGRRRAARDGLRPAPHRAEGHRRIPLREERRSRERRGCSRSRSRTRRPGGRQWVPRGDDHRR